MQISPKEEEGLICHCGSIFVPFFFFFFLFFLYFYIFIFYIFTFLFFVLLACIWIFQKITFRLKIFFFF
jgi:hypothetical protein